VPHGARIVAASIVLGAFACVGTAAAIPMSHRHNLNVYRRSVPPLQVADLDGDGLGDTVRVVFLGTSRYWMSGGWAHRFDRYRVIVGSQSIQGGGEGLDTTFSIVDVDSADGRLEIVLTEEGPSEDPQTHIYGFDGDSLRYLGTVGDAGIRFDGSGSFVISQRMRVLHTGWFPIRYGLDSDHRVVPLPRPSHPLTGELTARRYLRLQRSPTDERLAFRLEPGDVVRLVGTDDLEWVLVRDRSGRTLASTSTG
jgi:hypothetical protein